MKSALSILAMLLVGTGLVAAAPQEPAKVEPIKVAAEKQKPEERGQKLTSLHVQVMFTEYEGEKKISSLPYTFDVAPQIQNEGILHSANYGRRTELRNVVSIPYTTPKGDIEHQQVGTDIDCQAADLGDGRYALDLILDRSWFVQEPQKDSTPGVRRQVRAEAFPTVRDGQTVEAVVSTDPLSGHVYRVTVTASVAK